MNPSNIFLLVWVFVIQLLACRSTNIDVFDGPEVFQEGGALSVRNDINQRSLQETEAPSVAPSSSPSFSDEFELPFKVVWNMAFNNDTQIRESTEEELNGLFYATLKWLLASAREHYADRADVMVLDRIQFSHYGASFDASNSFPSTVAMECACYFQADNETAIPSVVQFLVAFSANFNRTVFLDDYLANADPVTSIYRNVTKLRYNIIPSDLGTSGVEIITLTINTEWNYEIGFGVPDRAPTEEEYDLLLFSTNDWMVHLLLDRYPPNSNGNPEFNMLENTVYDRTFDPNQLSSHSIRLLTDISFRVADASIPLGVVQHDLLTILSAADLSNYRDNYVHPAFDVTLGLFVGVTAITWSPLVGN